MIDQSGFPELLVVSQFPANDAGGGGALARQLLRGYPRERVSWWSCVPGGDQSIVSPAGRIYTFAPPRRLLPNKRAPRLKSFLLHALWVPLAAAHLRRVTARVRPRQVWALPYGWSIPVTFRAGIMPRFRTHVSIWDYVDNKGHRGLLSDQRAELFQRTLEKLYLSAATADVISKPMLEDLAQRTGRSHPLIVHSGLERIDIERLEQLHPAELPVIRLAYAGTIIVPSAFEFVVRALNSIRNKLPKPLVLEFFGGRNVQQNAWFNASWMKDHPRMDEAEFHQELQQCAWGLIVMDLSDSDPRYNRFSFPNKFGTYLATGVPLIVVGHAESSVVRVMREHSVGVWTSGSTVSDIAPFFNEALHEKNPHARFQSQILQAATTDFNMDAMRRRLWEAWGCGP